MTRKKSLYMFDKDSILFPDIFDLQMVDSAAAEPTDMETDYK